MSIATVSRDSRAFPWPRVAVTLAAMATAGIGLYLTRGLWLPGMDRPADVTTLHFETRHGEQQTIVLADNSVLHLNTDTAVTVQYSRARRTVNLTAGEAHLKVAHDSARPFHVLAGAADIVDVGTQFDVRLQQQATLVTVIEGRVAVGLRPEQHASSRTLQLEANQQVEVQSTGIPTTPTLVDAQRTVAWLQRQTVFDQKALASVAEEFSLYSARPIRIASPSLRSLPISGVFALEDTDTFVAFLRNLDGVRVEISPTQISVTQQPKNR